MLRMVIGIFACFATATALAAPPKKEIAEKVAGSEDVVVCKRFVRTGSLVDGYRACKTKREWARERENLRAFSVSNSCRNSGNGGPC